MHSYLMEEERQDYEDGMEDVVVRPISKKAKKKDERKVCKTPGCSAKLASDDKERYHCGPCIHHQRHLPKSLRVDFGLRCERGHKLDDVGRTKQGKCLECRRMDEAEEERRQQIERANLYNDNNLGELEREGRVRLVRLEERRKELGLNRPKLSDRTGIHPSSIRRYELDPDLEEFRDVGPNRAKVIAKALHTSVAYLIGEEDGHPG